MSANFNNVKVPISVLPRILKFLSSDNTTLLGGDLLDKNGQFTYDSWYYNYKESISDHENSITSIEIAKEYIESYRRRNGDSFFVVLITR